MQSIIQILKVNDAREIKGANGAFKVQDAECILLNEDGSVGKIGVLRIPEQLREVCKVGHFTAGFTLDAHWKDRQIGAVLASLQPLPADYFRKPAVAGLKP